MVTVMIIIVINVIIIINMLSIAIIISRNIIITIICTRGINDFTATKTCHE